MAKKYKIPKIEDLLKAGVHFGHQIRRWNPNIAPYIYTQRSGIHIIDLEDSHEGLKKACEALYDVASNGGQIIFVGTKKQAGDIIKLEAERCGALYVNERWLGGTITNFRVIRKNIDKLLDLKSKREKGEFEVYTKKERLLIDRDIEKLERLIGGIVGLKGIPAALFVVDVKREKTAVREANRAGVSVAALVDTNSDPRPVDYVIPGNDDAIRSIAAIVKVVADAVEEGYKDFAEKPKEEEGKKEEKKKEEEEEKKPKEKGKEKKKKEEKKDGVKEGKRKKKKKKTKTKTKKRGRPKKKD